MSSTKSVDMTGSGEPAWEQAVRKAVRALRYGSVEVQVHDGRVVQVQTREKVRFADDRRPDDQNETGDYRVQIRGYAHYDGRFFTGDDGALATDTFLARRARPIVQGTL